MNAEYYINYLVECAKGLIDKTRIVKHSTNIIDLIEAADFVNGEKIIEIIDIYNDNEEVVGRKLVTEYRSAQYNGLNLKYYLYNEDIKTILTHEQYEQNAYKVEEE